MECDRVPLDGNTVQWLEFYFGIISVNQKSSWCKTCWFNWWGRLTLLVRLTNDLPIILQRPSVDKKVKRATNSAFLKWNSALLILFLSNPPIQQWMCSLFTYLLNSFPNINRHVSFFFKNIIYSSHDILIFKNLRILFYSHAIYE